LWGKQAEDFDGSNNPILAIKAARVGEFNGGKNLSLINSSVLEKDPDLPEAHRYFIRYQLEYFRVALVIQVYRFYIDLFFNLFLLITV